MMCAECWHRISLSLSLFWDGVPILSKGWREELQIDWLWTSPFLSSINGVLWTWVQIFKKKKNCDEVKFSRVLPFRVDWHSKAEIWNQQNSLFSFFLAFSTKFRCRTTYERLLSLSQTAVVSGLWCVKLPGCFVSRLNGSSIALLYCHSSHFFS